MAIIYSYPTVLPTANDLVLGTDVDQAGKPTKNFTIQSIVDIVQQGATGLSATLALGNDAGNQAAIGFTNLIGTGTVTFGGFTDGNMTITNGSGTGFTSITSTDFVGNITGIVKAGSSIVGTVTGVTQNAGDNSTKLATTAYVDGKVDPSILTFAGTSGGNQTVNLAAQTFSLLGTANQIESVSTAQTITFRFPAAGVVLPDGSTATTQAATDDSTKVATTAFVRNYDDTQDLDFSGTTGTGAVVLNSQTLAIAGTANQIATSAGGQTLTIALTDPIVTNLTGNVTGILKDGSSIETTVTGITQAAGNDSTRLATTAYVDAAGGAKTLDYAGTATGPFALNLSTDDLEFNGDTNITVTAAAVAATKGIVTIDLNDDVGISGTMTAGTFTDGSFTGSAGTYTGYASITSTAFVGALTGNATTATALAAPGTIQLLSGSGATLGVGSNAVTYTSGGNVQLTTSLANTTVTGKTLLNLPTPTSSAIAAGDTVLEAMAKLQGQITASGGGGALAYEGAWRASVTAVAATALSSSTALVITTADANLVKGTVVEGTGITGTVRITAVTGTAVTLDTAITIANGITLTMSPPGGAITGATAGTAASLTTPANKISGRFYICDTVGKAEPNAAVPWAAATTPNEWAVGDWVVYISNGAAADEWQKIDQSNEIFGSGSTNKIAKWTASNTLGTGLIEDDGTTVTIGANGNLTVLGDTILGDNAAADTITLNGPTTFESTGRFKKGLALGTATDGSEYGATGQVLTASTSSGSSPTWTTPTTGTVTSVGLTETGDALTITNSPITSSGNINIAGAGAASQYINGELNLITFPTLDNYQYWTLSDGTNTTNISTTDTATFASGAGIINTEGSGIVTTQLRYDDSDNAGTLKNFVEAATTGTPTADDLLLFGDQAGGSAISKVKKATISSIIDLGNETLAQVLSTGNTTGGTDIAVSAGDDITFTDTSKAIFGDGSDLKIYSNGTDGYVEASVDDLVLQAADDVFIYAQGGEDGIKVIGDGAVELYHNAIKKFETSSTGTTTTGVSYISGSGLNINSDTVDSLITLNRTTGIWSIDNDSSYHLNFKATSLGATNLTLKSTGEVIIPDYGSGNNTGTPTFNLEVDSSGNIIETSSSGGVIPAGGSVSAKGGVFNFHKSIAPSSSTQQLFSILRPGTGAIAFRVTLTSGASAAVSRTKIFEVARCFGGGSPAFNQVIDSGPNTNTAANDFNVNFSTSTSGGGTTAGANSGQAVIPVNSTSFAVGIKVVQVGGGINRIPAGARIISMANQGSLGATITLDTNLTGFLSQGTTVDCVPDDIVVCRIIPQNTTTQAISATVELGYDNNTTATILSPNP